MRERGLAHHALAHQPSTQGHVHLAVGQFFRGLLRICLLQLLRRMRGPEIIRICPARRPQFLQFLLTLREQALFTGFRLRHYKPALRLASRKASRSPSNTTCGVPVSTWVRRSLIRDWSST